MKLIPRYTVMATLDEDGPQDISPWFSSRRKAGKWRYLATTRLKLKRNYERVIGRITGMDEEVNIDDHCEAIKLTRADKHKRPIGRIVTISIVEQLAIIEEIRLDIF